MKKLARVLVAVGSVVPALVACSSDPAGSASDAALPEASTSDATLPEAGWTLSVHNALGDSIYVVTGQDQKSTDIALLLLPPGDRFVGVLPEDLTYPAWQANIPAQSHPLGVRSLTEVRITVPADKLSPVAASLTANGVVTIVPGASHLMELTFDNGRQGKTVEIRPALPLVFYC